MARYLYSAMASTVGARINCDKSGNDEWFNKHTDKLESLCKEYMPSGSGFDCGTKLDLDASHSEKLVFTASFHHMTEGGYYVGWTEHTITVTPSFIGGFHVRVSGRNRNDIKEYIAEMFANCLDTMVDE